MSNSSEVSHFTLGDYFDPGPLRWLYFVIVLSMYVLIVLSNLLLIVVICLNRTLHEPMYLFLCSLFINELLGGAVLFPLLLTQIPQDVHTISIPLCFLQIFLLHSYAAIEFLILAVISYDRYLAICFPLQYSMRMNTRKVLSLIAVSWFVSFVLTFVLVFLTYILPRCRHTISKVYCTNYSVVKLSCSDTSVNNIYGLIFTFSFALWPLVFVAATYVRILKVCFNGSKQTRQKALSTCVPHLASITNYSFGVFFEVLGSRFDLSNMPYTIRVILSLYLLAVQPLFNPLIYGLKLTKVRDLSRNLLRSALGYH